MSAILHIHYTPPLPVFDASQQHQSAGLAQSHPSLLQYCVFAPTAAGCVLDGLQPRQHLSAESHDSNAPPPASHGVRRHAHSRFFFLASCRADTSVLPVPLATAAPSSHLGGLFTKTRYRPSYTTQPRRKFRRPSDSSLSIHPSRTEASSMDPVTPKREDKDDIGEVVVPWSPKHKVPAAFTREDDDEFFAPKRYYTKRIVRRGRATSGHQQPIHAEMDEEDEVIFIMENRVSRTTKTTDVSLRQAAIEPSLTLTLPAPEPCREREGG